jgi:hypothetical protein
MAYKTDFSKEHLSMVEQGLDLMRNVDYVNTTKDISKKAFEDDFRQKILAEMAGGKSLYQAFRRNKYDLFEIFEEIVNITIGEDVFESPFVERFVEVKNRGLGDRTDFYSEGGLLVVSSFAGNHWDTNRQSLDIGETVNLAKEWCYIHVYDELERFILGIVTMDKVQDKIRKSFAKFFNDRIYTCFNAIANVVPAALSAQGNSEAGLGTLVDKVQAKGGYNSITIAGTKGALRKLAQIVPDKMFANSQKEAKAQTGAIGDWEGNTLMIIPQTLKSGQLQVALSDSDVFILGADVKPIKLEVFGDTRTKSNTDGQENNDMSIDAQIQVKLGIGLICGQAFGKFTFQ